MLRYTLLLAVSLLLISSAAAQIAPPARLNVSVQGGVIRNLQPEDLRQPLYTLYPEVQIASRLFPLADAISLQGGLHWGYWGDGVHEYKVPYHKWQPHLIAYSHSSHIAGARFYVVPTKIPLVSLSLFSGLSWHFVSGGYVGGFSTCLDIPPSRCDDAIPPSDYHDYPPSDYHDRFKAWEAGLRVAVPLGNRLAVTTEVQKYIHRSIVERNPHKSQLAYKLGLSFGLF